MFERVGHWLGAAWGWLRQGPAWVVGAAGALAAGYLLGRKREGAETPALPGLPDAERARIEAELAEEQDRMRRARDAALAEIERAKEQELAVVVATQLTEEPALEKDLDETNAYLKKVGEKARGDR